MIIFQLTRDKKMLDEKLQEVQGALEAEENKAKGEHRARLKLESAVQELEEKVERENAVSGTIRNSKSRCIEISFFSVEMTLRRRNESCRVRALISRIN